MAKLHDIREVELGRVFLDLQNPRFEPVKDEPAAIEELCKNENVLGLAADIVERGSLNPLEIFGLLPAQAGRPITEKSPFIVAEGNRRLCALKLLHDPDKAPSRLKKRFRELADKGEVDDTILGVLFADRREAKPWLDRLHLAGLGGAGRKRWSADQQARHEGGGRNKASVDFLDWAEKEGLINSESRKGKLTTVDRFMSNPVFREKLGLDKSDPTQLHTTRPLDDVKARAKKFIDDLMQGEEVNSRKDSNAIRKYAANLERDVPVSGDRTDSKPISDATGDKRSRTKNRRKKPTAPQSPNRAFYSEELAEALKALGNYKLESIYHSIVSIELGNHTPLIAVGVWSLLESLTANCGRADKQDFKAFLSKKKLQDLGVTSGNIRTTTDAIGRLQGDGNTTKHHATGAQLNGSQLSNDLETVSPVLIALAKEAAAKSS